MKNTNTHIKTHLVPEPRILELCLISEHLLENQIEEMNYYT